MAKFNLLNNARAGFEAGPMVCPFRLPSPEGLAWLAGQWCSEFERPLPKSVRVTGSMVAMTWEDGRNEKLLWDAMRRRVARAPSR